MGTSNVTTKIIDAEMSVRWLIYICVKICNSDKEIYANSLRGGNGKKFIQLVCIYNNGLRHRSV